MTYKQELWAEAKKKCRIWGCRNPYGKGNGAESQKPYKKYS